MKTHQLSCAAALAALLCCMHVKTLAQTDWHITGNSGTNSATNFVGTTDNIALVFRTNNAERMRILATGNTGIGTNSPLQRLDVNGNINIRSGFALFMDNHRVLRADSLNRNTFLGVQSGAFLTTGFYNTATGHQALYANTTGSYNTATGTNALAGNTTGSLNVANGANALFSNNTGSSNIATGYAALYRNTGGGNNMAVGNYALYNSTTASYNMAAGNFSMYYNSSGTDNAAYGYTSLYNNTTGAKNVAVGKAALYANQIGGNNIAIGESALYNNQGHSNIACGSSALFSQSTAFGANVGIGDHALYAANSSFNTAVGDYIMYKTTSGAHNVAMGYGTLGDNTTGWSNTAVGSLAMDRNTTGHYNTGIGYHALFFTTASQYNTAVGYSSGHNYDNGWNNVFVGANTDVNGAGYYNVVAIGQGTICTDVSQARIGNSATSSIGGYANWTNISDVRVKKNIKENVPGLAFINKLKPITYNLDLEAADKIIQPPARKDAEGKTIQPAQKELDLRKEKEQIFYTGFAAQDVEKAAKELNFDFSGVDAAKNSKSLYGLRYAEFVVPLVKAVQELSKQNDELKKQNELQQEQINELKAMIVSNQPSVAVQQSVVVTGASLEQNVPNPFNRTTTISYTLPQSRQGRTNAQIIISDQNGKIVKQINISGAGKGAVNADASALSSGTYTYALLVDGKRIGSRQMILTK